MYYKHVKAYYGSINIVRQNGNRMQGDHTVVNVYKYLSILDQHMMVFILNTIHLDNIGTQDFIHLTYFIDNTCVYLFIGAQRLFNASHWNGVEVWFMYVILFVYFMYIYIHSYYCYLTCNTYYYDSSDMRILCSFRTMDLYDIYLDVVI